MSNQNNNQSDEEPYNILRRNVLKIGGGLTLTALATAGLVGEEAYEQFLGPDYVEEGTVEDQAREAGEAAVEEATQKEVYKGIGVDDFEDIYETLRDYSAEDYDVTVGGSEELHDKVLEEDFYDTWTNDRSDESLKSVDLRWGKYDAVDSKIGYEVEIGDEERFLEEEIQDGVAEAFVDAAEENFSEEELEDYEVDNW